MTQRERDILKASVSWTDKTLTVNEEKAFQAGAEWADKTMVDKFLYWLTMKSPFIDNKDMDKAIVELKKYLEE